MDQTAYTILFIDDHCSAYLPALEPAANVAGFSIHPKDNVLEGLEYLKEYDGTIHAVILDLSFPKGEMQGIEALQKIKQKYPLLPVVMLTDSDSASDIDRVIECMKKGAYNYVGKRTLNPVYLFQVTETAIHQSRLLVQAEKRAAVKEENKERFFTIKQTEKNGRFKQSAIFGFELVSVNLPFDEKEEAYLKIAAFEWHTNLLKAISSIYFDEVQVNLKYMSENGQLKCRIIFTLYAIDEVRLDIIIRNVQHDINLFFNSDFGSRNLLYLFSPITDTEFLQNANRLTTGLKHTVFYRKPVKWNVERKIGFESAGNKNEGTPEYSPDELCPFPQNLSYDNELFKALQNQKDYAEVDVQLVPKNLLKQEIDFIRQSANNIHALDIKKKNKELIQLYTDYLQQFLINVKDKFLISVVCKRKSSQWERHLFTAIGNFFFGLDADFSYRSTNDPEALHRFCISAEGITNQLPFFYDATTAFQAFRLPVPAINEIPGIKAQSYIFHSLPENLSAEGILLGDKQGVQGNIPIRITEDAMARHLYIMGQTGTGKSTLLKTMIADCLQKKYGFALIDPHGDLFDEIQKLVPKNRRNKLIILNTTDPENSAKHNPIGFDENNPQSKSLVINELIRIFGTLYDMRIAGGPMFELYLKNGLLLVMDEKVLEKLKHATLTDFVKLFFDAEFRKELLSLCGNQKVVDFFKVAEKNSGDWSFNNFATYITSKLTRFTEDYYLTPIISSKKGNINFRKLIDDGNILLVKMDKGLIGSDNVSLLGQMLVSSIVLAAMSRANMEKQERKPFYLFIDEFQNFIKGDIGSALSEVRKYGLSLTLANQTLGQLEQRYAEHDLVESLMGNVGSMIFFRPGINDYEKIKHYVEPEFKREDVLKLPNFNCIARLLIENVPSEPFVFQTKNEL